MKKEELRRLRLAGWPIPDEFLIELGRISALWTSLEWMMETYIGKLAGFNDLSDPKPFILLRHTSFPQKLDILSALCEKLVPYFSNLSGYEDVVSQIRTAQKSRNRFIHNSVGFDAETKKATLSVGSARGTVKTSIEDIDILDIRATSIEIHETMRNLHRLVTGKEYPSITETRKEQSND
jgi:hypothetical protein